ncbi:MAG: hypothetical protein ACJAX5_002634, partial [Patiriisocius sp.]
SAAFLPLHFALHFCPPADLVETNALNNKIKDLAERTDVLRGYL